MVIGMTDMTIITSPYPINPVPARQWRLRTGMVALSAAVVAAAMFGPAPIVATRLGAGETVGFATVSAADTITSSDVLAEVAASVRNRVSKIV
jgi:hypothetical protein